MKNKNKLSLNENSNNDRTVKHGLLAKDITGYEIEALNKLVDRLTIELQPNNLIEEKLIERMAKHILTIDRIDRAEREYIEAQLNPRIESCPEAEIFMLKSEIIEEGFLPRLGSGAIRQLLEVYSRYETSEENKLFRAINFYNALKAVTVVEK